jgi:helix-turn-helix protein
MLTAYASKLLQRQTAAPAPSKSFGSSTARADGPAPGAPAAAIPPGLARFGRWMRLREVADYLGVSPSQITALREAGELEAINISSGNREGLGADWRISLASVAAFEAKRRNQPAP